MALLDHHKHLFIPGYNVMFKNRTSQSHGGVCTYIKNLIPYKRLSDLEDPEFEVLWSHIRPPRLPRGTSCIIVGTIYRVYQKKVDNFETALNLAKRLDV